MDITLERYHGLGNDYLVYDPNKNDLKLNKENVSMLCDRNMGLGSDGILEGPFDGEKHMALRIWNPDGSIAAKSGNGVRIFAKYLRDAGYVQKKNYLLETDGGVVEITYLNEDASRLRISMGKVSFFSDEIPVTCVSVGNPHCVIPMREISKPLVCKIGDFSEVARYFPERINTEIMKVLDNNNIAIETFERGAGYTLATGTGACAAAAVSYKLGMTGNKVIVHMPGGELQVEIDEDWNAYMTGDVFYVANINLSNEFVEKLRVATAKGE